MPFSTLINSLHDFLSGCKIGWHCSAGQGGCRRCEVWTATVSTKLHHSHHLHSYWVAWGQVPLSESATFYIAIVWMCQYVQQNCAVKATLNTVNSKLKFGLLNKILMKDCIYVWMPKPWTWNLYFYGYPGKLISWLHRPFFICDVKIQDQTIIYMTLLGVDWPLNTIHSYHANMKCHST